MAQQQMMHATNATNGGHPRKGVGQRHRDSRGHKDQLADVDLLNIKIRLLVCSVDKAMQMGINWWQQDSYLSTTAKDSALNKENAALQKRIERLEQKPAQSSRNRRRS